MLISFPEGKKKKRFPTMRHYSKVVKSIGFGIRNSARGLTVLPVTSYMTLGRSVTWVSHLPNGDTEKIKWDNVCKALAHCLAQNKPSNYYYYLKLWELSVHLTTLWVKVFPSAKLGGWTRFLRLLAALPAYSFSSWVAYSSLFSPHNNHLHLHSTFNFKIFSYLLSLLIFIIALWGEWVG